MTPANFTFLSEFLKSRSGLIVTSDKQYLLDTRLMPIARRHGFADLDALAMEVRRPGANEIAVEVVEAMTTNETFFYRDKTPFDNLTDTILPNLMTERQNRKIRIWCAAASSGQEPYSIAMSIKELGAKAAGWTFEIVGTDLSEEILAKAKSGLYTQFEVQRGLPVQHLLKYFTQKEEGWEISQEIRRMVQFRPLNLLKDFSALGGFDIVFCRNVLIYFDRETKTEVLDRISRQLSKNGYLVLGAAETVVGITGAFNPVPQKRGLYQVDKDEGAGAARPALRLAG